METSYEQRLAVARDECRMQGHNITIVLVHGMTAPQKLICSRCGASWRIHPDDVEQNFAGLSINDG